MPCDVASWEPLALDYIARNPSDRGAYWLHRFVIERQITPLPLVMYPGCFAMRETDHGLIMLVRMLYNWRLCLGDECTIEQGYCFTGAESTRNALDAALAWSGEGEAPGRWYKAVHTGEVRREHAYHEATRAG